MRNLALVAALIIVPLTAAADEVGPEPPVVEPTTTTTTTTEPDGTTTTTTITALGVTPAAPPATVQVVEEDPCGVHKHARWRHRMKGRLSIGFSKSHVELDGEDGAGE